MMMTSTLPHPPTQYSLEFELGNPSVELITGRLILTEPPPQLESEDATAQEEEIEDELVQSEDDLVDAMNGLNGGSPQPDSTNTIINRESTCIVYIFDIPAHLTLHELYAFLLDAHGLLHIQLIRIPTRKSSSDPTYSALLQFRSPTAATTFVNDYDQLPYNSLEPEVCITGFVWKVIFDEEEKYLFPTTTALSTGSVTPIPQQLTLGKSHSREAPSPLFMGASALSTQLVAPTATALTLPPAATPSATSTSLTPSHTPALNGVASEPTASAPSCPVCLEPIVLCSSTPMLTILCNHVFHFDCLSKWIPSSNSSSCPVCRYMMQPNVNTQCSVCKATDKLWLCILCGHVGCSRYVQGHAHQHFEQTSHNYAIEVLTQRVWDYTADCYVHRLVRNKTDGKLVELSRVRTLDDDFSRGEHCTPIKSLPPMGNTSMTTATPTTARSTNHPGLQSPSPTPIVIQPSSSAYASVKLEEFLLEYNYLLSSQLEQQRRIFQLSLKQREMDMNERRQRLEKAHQLAQAKKSELEQKLEQAKTKNDEQTKKLSELQFSHQTMLTQSTQLSSLHNKLLQDQSSFRSSVQTSAKLYADQQESILKGQDEQIHNLEEQIHDLQFWLDTQKKIDRMDAQSKKGGTSVGLKAKLRSGKAELQLVEVTPNEEEEMKGKRKKRRG